MKTYNPTPQAPETEINQVMAGKPVCLRPSNTSIAMSAGFAHKELTTGPVMNLGDACVYSCTYCYVEPASQGAHEELLSKLNLEFQDVVIRRCGSKPGETALDTLKSRWQSLPGGNVRWSFTPASLPRPSIPRQTA